MTLADSYEELTEHLSGEVDTERFTVHDTGSADWALRVVAKHRRRLAADEAVASAESERIAEWLAGQRQRCEEATAYLESLLTGWHRLLLDDDPKVKTVRLPAGALVARKAPDRVEVDLEPFLLGQEQGSPLVRVKREADKPEVLRHVKQTGELPAGVELVTGEVQYTVKTDPA